MSTLRSSAGHSTSSAPPRVCTSTRRPSQASQVDCEIVRDDSSLEVGHVFELVRRADIAQSPDPVGRGAQVLVDGYPPVGFDLDAAGGRVQPVAIRAPAHGDQYGIDLAADKKLFIARAVDPKELAEKFSAS